MDYVAPHAATVPISNQNGIDVPEQAGVQGEWVLRPELEEAEPCARCGAKFILEENSGTACCFHADGDGNIGEFVVNSNDQTSGVPAWTCCGHTDQKAKGCVCRPHICKEMMLSVRAQATPCILVDDTVEITILPSLEIAFFPGSSYYYLNMKLTRALADVLHTYFSMQVTDSNDKDLDESNGGKDGDGAYAVESDVRNSPNHNENIGAKDRQIAECQHHEKSSESPPRGSRVKSKPVIQEGLYINYLRLGDIILNITTTGFPLLNVNNLNITVDSFVKRGEIMDWQRLLWLLEMHTTWCVTSNIASGGINRFKRMVSGVFNGGDNRSLFLGNGEGGDKESDFVDEYVESEELAIDEMEDMNLLSTVPEADSVTDSGDDYDMYDVNDKPEVKHNKLSWFLRGKSRRTLHSTKHKGVNRKIASKQRYSVSKPSWKGAKRYVGDPKFWSADVLRRVTRSHNYLPADTKANLLLGGAKYSHC